MTFSWQNEDSKGNVVDRLLICSVDGHRIGKLHFYKGVGYFAYFLDERLNSSPLTSLKEAMNLVQDAYLRQRLA
jgi:hypothetical protein